MTGEGWLPVIPWDVLRARCFSAVQGRVLFVLWSRCGADGWCSPGLPSIAADSGCNQKTAKVALQVLEQQGVIEVTRSTGTSNHYHLDPDHILNFVHEHTTPTKTGWGTPPKSGSGTPPKSGVGTKTTPPESGGTPPPKQGGVPHPNLGDEEEPIEEPLKKIASSSPPVLPSSEPTETPPRAAEAAASEKPTKVRTPKAPKPPPAVTNDFQDAMVERFGPTLGEERVRFEINRALAHDAAKKYSRYDLYVEGWLRREAERTPQQQYRSPPFGGSYRNGNQSGSADGTGPPKHDISELFLKPPPRQRDAELERPP